MSQIVQSDGVGVLLAPEGTPGVQPTASWLQLQPNPGGITAFTRQNVVVERHILSPNMTPERGEVVGYDVSPKLVMDLTQDGVNAIREPLFRSATKHNGGTGTSFFRPTAVTTTQFTVAAAGALQAGTLVWARGFANPANNGIFVVQSSSGATDIKVTGTVAEGSPPTNATLEVCGFQFTSGDAQIDASGNFICTTADLTTMGLQVGQDVWVGDPTSGAAFAFATAAYTGKATIAAIIAGKLTLKLRVWAIASADTGASQTIRLLFGRWIRQVPITSGDYLAAPTSNMEVSEPGAGTAGATDYTYVGGCGLDTLSLAIPLEGKVVATVGFVGMSASEPGPSRATGASTAYQPLASSVYTTNSNVKVARLLKQADETELSAEIDDITIAVKNNITPRKQIGTSGAAGLVYGEYTPTIDLDIYVLANDVTRAADANTDTTFDILLKSADGGFSLNFPMGKLSKADKTYAASKSAMQKLTFTANRDPATGLLYSMTQFPYLP